MSDSSDRATRALARLLVRIFYRDAEVQGEAVVPEDGPVLFVANHGNALVDPMVLVACLPRLPRFLAKHTLWSNPAVRPLLSLAGSIPVYRAQDGDTRRNDETFRVCFEQLAAGNAVALFPEGISHDEPSLQPLRTGAARIALGARAAGAEPMTIIPVGLTFEEKGRFRSRLLVTVGEPIVPAPEMTTDDAEATRALTQQIDEGLRDVTLNFESWEAHRLAEQSAAILAAAETRATPGRAGLGEHFTLRRALGNRYEQTRDAHPERFAALETVVERYQHLIEDLGLRDDHVTADYTWQHSLRYVGYRVPALLWRLPFALVGLILNFVPYQLAGRVARIVRHEGDQPATYKVLTGLVGFPLFWAIESALAAWAWGAPGGFAMAVLAPVTGWIALRFFERNESFWSELRAWLTLRLLPHRGEALRTLRREIRKELAALLESEAKEAEADAAPEPPAS